MRGSSPEFSRLKLTVSRAEVERLIRAQRKKGEDLLKRIVAFRRVPLISLDKVEEVVMDVRKWDDFNTEVLRSSFNTDTIAREYAEGPWAAGKDIVEDTRRLITLKNTKLESILDRLSLYPEPKAEPTAKPIDVPNYRVFLVHGRDEGIKQTVARFLEKLGLEVVILHEQPSQGRTVIEKFEDYSAVGFAVVLLTADDVGGQAPKDSPRPSLSPRARQNVIFELGYFVGKLGRERTCALLEKGVDRPSDFEGIVYVPLEGKAWKLGLARELKTAGYNINLDKAFS